MFTHHDADVRAWSRGLLTRFGLAFLVLAAASTGCAAPPSRPANVSVVSVAPVDPTPLGTPGSDRRARYEYHVLAGEMALQRGRKRIAAREYVAALSYSNDPALAERAMQIAIYANERELAYRAARAWAAGRPHALDAQRAAARLAFLAGHQAGLQRYARALVAAAPSPRKGYQLLATMLGGATERADIAIAVLRRMAQDNPRSAPAEYALGVVALGYGRPKIAAPAAARALRLDPGWIDAAMLQAGVWIRQGRPAKAQRLIAGLPGDAAARAGYHMGLARMLLQAAAEKAARDEFAMAVELQPADADARYGLAVLSLTTGDLDRAQSEFETLYKDGAHADEAAYYLGAISEQRDQYARAQTWYQRVNHGEHRFEAQLRAARMIYQQGHLDSARTRLAQLRQTFPDQKARIFAAEGELLFEAGRYQVALKMYDEALAKNAGSNELYYGRSLVYERLGRIKAAEQDLRRMLANDSNDSRALNALGYMLANHSQAYHKALGYIRKALRADPDNPAIQDSMGWVQYRLGHLQTARRYLQKAYKQQPDAEIGAHLGEVRWQQGAHDAARRIWHDALSKHPDNAALRSTMKRFGQ